MVRRRVEIKKIEEKSKMYTTFTKRRQGLFKKTKVLCTMCEAEAAVLTFSKAGNAFFFGHPSVESVVKRYFADQSTNSEIEGNQDEFVVEPIPEAEKKIVELMGKGRVAWDVGVRNLGLFELDELAAAIQEIKNKVVAQAQEIINNGDAGCGTALAEWLHVCIPLYVISNVVGSSSDLCTCFVAQQF